MPASPIRPTILWLRRDLRLHDLPALVAAAGDGGPVLPLFVVDDRLLAGSDVRTAALVDALTAAQESYDGAILIRRGDPAEVIPALAREIGATSVHISAEGTPFGRRRDTAVGAALPASTRLIATGSPYAVGPGTIRTTAGTGYQVFTPFSRAWRSHGWPAPAPLPPQIRWHTGLAGEPVPTRPDVGAAISAVGEQAAHERWAHFRDGPLQRYRTDRDRPDLDGTSALSVQLKFGTIHPRTLLADLAGHRGPGRDSFTGELAWREFYADVLWHHPASAWSDLKPSLAEMVYDDPATDADTAQRFTAWQHGRTGYPMVDAGMRQLLSHGWMHNRVRMLTASFLAKHLHIWWTHGARHFMRHLADGDIASNNHGWQWVAGTGTDAAPYFRIFNPVTQGLKFDPNGDYVRRHIPQLRHLDGAAAHQPWSAPDGYEGGYARRIVDHAQAREEALGRYQTARAAS